MRKSISKGANGSGKINCNKNIAEIIIKKFLYIIKINKTEVKMHYHFNKIWSLLGPTETISTSTSNSFSKKSM